VELDNIVDISYAVSPEKAQGRKRMKNMATGEVWWEGEAQGRKRMKNMATGEVWWEGEIHAKPVELPKEQITPLEDHVVIKPKAKKHGA
jgi:hypothetical protein